jgi:hypothetical protein
MEEYKRARSIAALNHVLTTVLEASEGSRYHLAFESAGVETIEQLLQVEMNEWKEVPLEGTGSPKDYLNVKERRELYDLRLWYMDQLERNVTTWMTLTRSAFQHWREEQVLSGRPDSESVKSFKAVIGISISDYPELTVNDVMLWPAWDRKLRLLGSLHDLDNVFNPAYQPKTIADKKLFDCHQKFIYAVLIMKVEYPVGKCLVTSYLDRRDAQAAYAELRESARPVVAAKLTKQIKEMRLEANRKKGFADFLCTWKTLIRDLDYVLDEPIDDSTKLSWLESCLRPHHGLSSSLSLLVGDDIEFNVVFSRLLMFTTAFFDLEHDQLRQPGIDSEYAHADYVPDNVWAEWSRKEKHAYLRRRAERNKTQSS